MAEGRFLLVEAYRDGTAYPAWKSTDLAPDVAWDHVQAHGEDACVVVFVDEVGEPCECLLLGEDCGFVALVEGLAA